jgi:uncharacterized protein (DUF2147 family)
VRAVARLALFGTLLVAVVTPARAEDSVLGRWATPGVSAIVELAPCPGASTLCGTIRWLWDAVDESGRPRLDAQNTDGGLRSRPLLGLSVLAGLAPAAGSWSGRILQSRGWPDLPCDAAPSEP